jgi:hypothetical protein
MKACGHVSCGCTWREATRTKKDKSLDYFKKLRDNFETRPTVEQIFNERALKVGKRLLASYEISKLIAKAGKPGNR